MSSNQVEVLTKEVALLREKLEQGVNLTKQENAQKAIQIMLVAREKEVLKHQLKTIKDESNTDVTLAFKEARRLHESNSSLKKRLTEAQQEVSLLRQQLVAANCAHQEVVKMMNGFDKQRIDAQLQVLEKNELISSLRKNIATHFRNAWDSDEAKEHLRCEIVSLKQQLKGSLISRSNSCEPIASLSLSKASDFPIIQQSPVETCVTISDNTTQQLHPIRKTPQSREFKNRLKTFDKNGSIKASSFSRRYP